MRDLDPIVSFTHVGKSDIFWFLFTAVHLSPQRQRYHNFLYFEHYVYWNFLYKVTSTCGWNGFRSALDADTDPAKMMPVRPDPILDALYLVQAVENKVREGAEPWTVGHGGQQGLNLYTRVHTPSWLRETAPISVAYPDPAPDPYVFGPPGSGSISTRYGSGSGYFYHQAKTIRENLNSYCFVAS